MNWRMLLIEDNPADARLIQILLAEDRLVDWQVRVVEKLEDIGAALEEAPYDLVVLDLNLPNSRGLVTFDYVRERTPSVLPIIVLTGTTDEAQGLDAITRGAEEYLMKEEALAADPGSRRFFLRSLRHVVTRSLCKKATSESEQRLHTLIAVSPMAVAEIDATGRVCFWNPAAQKIFGYDPSEVIDQELHSLVLSDALRERFQAGFRHFQETGTGPLIERPLEVMARRKDGTEFPCEVFVAAIGREDGFHAIGYARDLTHGKRIEAQLIAAEKLGSLGEMVAGVAHELNNPLTAVIGFLSLAQRAQELELKTRQRLDTALHEAERCAGIIQHLLTFARQSRDERSPLVLSETLQRLLEIKAYELRGDNIALSWDFARPEPSVRGNGTHLQQVMVNLITNAAHALSNWPGTRDIRIRATTPNEHAVVVSITDTGPGMSEEVRRKAFDPFFTTKPLGVGTGLGLSLVHSIIAEHGGAVELDTAPGRGVTVTITLPVCKSDEGARDDGAVTQDPAAADFSQRRVLVVDDEANIRALLCDLLDNYSCPCDQAHDGAQALEWLGKHHYDLILCDIRMPGMDGRALYQAIEQKYPAMLEKVVFLTGDAVRESSREFLDATSARYLTKPVRIKDFDGLIREMLLST